jgi:hypothetical protein
MTVDVVFDPNDHDEIIMYQDAGDSACWTGHYLAAIAHKYNVTSSD